MANNGIDLTNLFSDLNIEVDSDSISGAVNSAVSALSGLGASVNIDTSGIESEYKKLKQEVSRLASLANKRLARLESHGFDDSPAYKKWIESGGEKFGVKGKDYNQLQKELARIRQFTGSISSTVRGAKQLLNSIASTTGMNANASYASAKEFFQVASIIEQYIRSTEGTASAIGYQKIWQAINEYANAQNMDLSAIKGYEEQIAENIAKMLGYESVIEAANSASDSQSSTETTLFVSI